MSQTVEANIAVARRMYELWNGGGAEGFEQVWAPDIVFHEAPELPDTGVFHGAEALAAHCRELIETAGHYQFNVRQLEGCGDYVLAALEVSVEGPSSGAAVTAPVFHIARYRDGQLVEMHSYLDGDQARLEYERSSAPCG